MTRVFVCIVILGFFGTARLSPMWRDFQFEQTVSDLPLEKEVDEGLR